MSVSSPNRFPDSDRDDRLRKRKRSPTPIKGSREEIPKKYNSNDSNVNIYGKTGGAYIPPAKLRQLQAKITDKSSEAYQRIAWEALKKSIHGFINKVNVSNISEVVRQLLSENVVRGRGLLVRSLLIAQTASPTFTHVFAALVAIVNSKFPQVGELVLKRLINEFRKAFRRNQKDRCLSSSRFLAHLVNQKVVHELIVLELLTLLLEQTTDDSVEVSVAVLKECGAMLTRLVPKGVHGVFEHLRRILNEGNCDKRISYMLEVMFQIRRDGWKDHPIVLPELDLIQEDDQITHTTSLLDQVNPEDNLNVFRFDPDYIANEEKYAQIKASFFDDSDNESEGGSNDDDEEDGSGSEAGSSDAEGERGAQVAASADGKQTIVDQTETNLVHLRRTIYLMLQSSLSADEAGHRLCQLKIRPGEEYEVASMVLDCCAQTRSYESRYGRLAQRLCHVLLNFGNQSAGPAKAVQEELGPGSRYKQKVEAPKRTEAAPVAEPSGPVGSYVTEFEKIFSEQYAIIHRLETAKLRNVAFFFAHLLYTDSISWGVLECVKLNERDTTSSGRIFIKHLFLELCSFMGLAKLQARLRDDTLKAFFAGLFPRDSPKDTRFAINFFTTIGLGGLTLDLREHLQASREAAMVKREIELTSQMISDDDEDASSSSSSSSSESSANDDASHRSPDSKITHKLKRHSLIEKKKRKDASKVSRKKPKSYSENQPLPPKNRSEAYRSRPNERPPDTPFCEDVRNSPPPYSQMQKDIIDMNVNEHTDRAHNERRNPSPSTSLTHSRTLKSAVKVVPMRNQSPPDIPDMSQKSRVQSRSRSRERFPHKKDRNYSRHREDSHKHHRDRHTSRKHRGSPSPSRSHKRHDDARHRRSPPSSSSRSPFTDHRSSTDRLCSVRS